MASRIAKEAEQTIHNGGTIDDHMVFKQAELRRQYCGPSFFGDGNIICMGFGSDGGLFIRISYEAKDDPSKSFVLEGFPISGTFNGSCRSPQKDVRFEVDMLFGECAERFASMMGINLNESVDNGARRWPKASRKVFAKGLTVTILVDNKQMNGLGDAYKVLAVAKGGLLGLRRFAEKDLMMIGIKLY